MFTHLAFNSLSRDHPVRGRGVATRSEDFTFNSLSRDHEIKREITVSDFGKYLSTPSLGITAITHHPRSRARESTSFNSLSRDHVEGSSVLRPCARNFAFNSLSRDHSRSKDRGIASGGRRFQLPLSGSQTPIITGPPKEVLKLSTPSLGITCVPPTSSESRCGCSTFNSLSRDHRARFRDFPALRGFLPRHLFAQMISKTTIWIYRFAPL